MNAFYSKATNSIYLAVICSVSVILLVLTLGCQSSTAGTAAVQATATTSPSPTLIREDVQTEATPSVTATVEPTDEPLKLVWWTVEEVSPDAEGESGDFMANSLQTFSRNHPDIEVEVILKKAGGKGGMLDFLRTAKEVAPTILPDVAVIDATDLTQAYAGDLIQPHAGKLDRSIVQDLLPAARRMGTIEDELVGVPLGLEMEHTVYNRLVFTEPPLLWRDIFTANTRYLFPARGVNGLVNDLTLAQYFSAGGRLLDGEGAPTIDEGVLRSVLDVYQQGVENGVIDPLVLEASTVQELWSMYVEGRAGVAQTTVHQYLIDQELLINTDVSPLPVQIESDTPVYIMHGWVLVLVADNQNLRHQAAAVSLIEWFMETRNNAAWNDINNSIPTRNSSYQQLASDDPYWEFLAEQLNTAQPQPGFVGYDQLGRIIQQAVVQVISGEATAEEATATAIDALGQ